MILKALKDNALKLNAIDKIKLIEILHDSLDMPSPEVEEKWAKESEKRFRLYKQGKSKAIPLSRIQRKYTK